MMSCTMELLYVKSVWIKALLSNEKENILKIWRTVNDKFSASIALFQDDGMNSLHSCVTSKKNVYVGSLVCYERIELRCRNHFVDLWANHQLEDMLTLSVQGWRNILINNLQYKISALYQWEFQKLTHWGKLRVLLVKGLVWRNPIENES